MSAGTYNFILEQGSDHEFDIEVLGDSDAPRDLTGYQVKGIIKLERSDPEPWAEMSFDTQNLASGELTVKINGYATTGKPFKKVTHDDYYRAVYDIIIFNSEDMQERILQGEIKISPEVTQQSSGGMLNG